MLFFSLAFKIESKIRLLDAIKKCWHFKSKMFSRVVRFFSDLLLFELGWPQSYLNQNDFVLYHKVKLIMNYMNYLLL